MARSGRDHNLDDQRQPVTRSPSLDRPTEEERPSRRGRAGSSGDPKSLVAPVDSRALQTWRLGSHRMPYR